MEKKKLILLDIDGTLVTMKNKKQYIPESAVRAVHEARMNGALVYLCTGRSAAEAFTIPDVETDGMIGAAGALIMQGNDIVYHQKMAEADVSEIVQILNGENCKYFMERNSGLYFSQIDEGDMDGLSEDPKYMSIVKKAEDADLSDINKITLLARDNSAIDRITELLAGKYKVTDQSSGAFIAAEISVLGISKATAIKKLTESFDFETETYAFGDSMNDLEMLQACDHACVMGNGREELKKYAEYVTDSILDDGIEKAFRHYQLIR